uniref:DUF2177 family protein n=1 Tax=viral metagenome TaxID=1070528 RepID=A0A6C0F697_9ZZZZ
MGDLSILFTAIIFVCIDSLYLTLMSPYMLNQVKSVQGSPLKMNFLAAIICYLFLVFGLYYFIIKPKRSIRDAFLLGVVIYSVFELTNMAIFKNWSIFTVLLDTLWGGVLFGTTTYLIRALKV